MLKRCLLAFGAIALMLIPSGAKAGSNSFTIVSVGDIAKKGGQHMAVAELVKKLSPSYFIALGDNAYETGTIDEYRTNYDPSFSSLRVITRPIPGNHEYFTNKAAGYFAYFDPNQSGIYGSPQKGGYYSFKQDKWLFIALDSECDKIDCDAQNDWLKKLLADNPTSCVAAYWHKPRFTSSPQGHKDYPQADAFWQTLYPRASFILNGHNHFYSRTYPLDQSGNRAATGITQFVVGTGGAPLYKIDSDQDSPNYSRQEKQIDTSYGVLKIDFVDNQYTYHFISSDQTTLDSGSGVGRCDATPVKAPQALATAQSPPKYDNIYRQLILISAGFLVFLMLLYVAKRNRPKQ